MPSVSKSQQRLMGMAWAYSQGKLKLNDISEDVRDTVKDLASNMKKKDLSDFAHTKHDGIPEKKTSMLSIIRGSKMSIIDTVLKESHLKLSGKTKIVIALFFDHYKQQTSKNSKIKKDVLALYSGFNGKANLEEDTQSVFEFEGYIDDSHSFDDFSDKLEMIVKNNVTNFDIYTKY